MMAAVFWDRKGMLEPGTTITSETYCETLEKTAQSH